MEYEKAMKSSHSLELFHFFALFFKLSDAVEVSTYQRDFLPPEEWTPMVFSFTVSSNKKKILQFSPFRLSGQYLTLKP